MGRGASWIVQNSFNALLKNKTVMTFAFISGLVSAAFSLFLLSQVQQLSALSSSQSLNVVLAALISFLKIAAPGVLIVFLIGIFITGAIMSGASSDGSDIGDAVSQSLSRYLSLLGTTILVGIVVGIGFILLVIPGIFLWLKFSVAGVEAVVGKKGIIESMKSSWEATGGNLVGILVTLIAMGIAVFIITFIIGFVFSFVGLTPVSNLLSVFVGSASTVALVLIYQGLSGSDTQSSATMKKGKN